MKRHKQERNMNPRIASVIIALIFFAGFFGYASAQSQPDQDPGRLIGGEDIAIHLKRKAGPSLSARLFEVHIKALKKSATVIVRVRGIKLVDPDSVNEIPAKGQGHLHYRLDDGPIIATTATTLSFHDLSSGHHSIVVNLAANNHSLLGPRQVLEFVVP
ncbi:MAG: hypothetical protein ACYCPQ_08420 [Elusimicrobiota bacterium]